MRLVGTGTEDKLWTPTGEQLALDNWDASYIEHADLSGLEIPPHEDADFFDCLLQGTIFPENGTALTQIRVTDPKKRLLALDGATLDPDSSSYNHHFVAEGMRQAENNSDPINIFIRDYVLADYSHSWSDALYEAINLFGKKNWVGTFATP